MPNRRHLETIFSAIDEGFCLCEIIRDDGGVAVDYRFVEINQLFETMTGLSDAKGRTAREMTPGLEAHWVETYGRVADGEVLRFQNRAEALDRAEALGRWFDVFATPVAPHGHFAIVFRDITAQRDAENAREAAVAEAGQLLTELNHRVMNSLAMIGSIVRMEAQHIDSASESGQVIQRLQTRLAAVTNLYRALNQAAYATEVPAADYLEAVAMSVNESVAQSDQVLLLCDIAPVMLPTEQAAPLGLLVNELMTNAVKYAFAPDTGGIIRVSLLPIGESLCLTVQDDGNGDATGGDVVAAAEASHGSGMGTQLIEGFTEQLGGTVLRSSGPEGTRVVITFPTQLPAFRLAG